MSEHPTARQLGINPRVLKSNPRARGTNPRAKARNRWALRNWKRSQRKAAKKDAEP
jgi:hypothetical protein